MGAVAFLKKNYPHSWACKHHGENKVFKPETDAFVCVQKLIWWFILINMSSEVFRLTWLFWQNQMLVDPLLDNSPPVGEQLLLILWLTFRSILWRRQSWLLFGQFFCLVSSVETGKGLSSVLMMTWCWFIDSPEAVVSVTLVVTADSDLKVSDAERTRGGGGEAGIQL